MGGNTKALSLLSRNVYFFKVSPMGIEQSGDFVANTYVRKIMERDQQRLLFAVLQGFRTILLGPLVEHVADDVAVAPGHPFDPVSVSFR